MEWRLDSLASYVPGAVMDPFVTVGPDRVIRGGDWGVTPICLRSTYRWCFSPGFANGQPGFRVVLAPVRAP